MGADKDRLGLARLYAVVSSDVQSVFTPHKPISDIDMLKGRETEVSSLLEIVTESGLHGFVVGERGVGKSSLANTVMSLVQGQPSFRHQSTQDCKFEDLLENPLRDLCNIEVTLTGRTGEETAGAKGSAGFSALSAEAHASRKSTAAFDPPKLTAGSAAKYLKDVRAVLVIDEADALRDADTKRRLAEFVKALSDNNALFKVVVVGIARTASDLIDDHPSAARAIREIILERMSTSDLSSIITNAERSLSIRFEPSVRSRIVKLSCGYPYFVHLIAGESAKSALVRARTAPNPTGFVVESDLRQALRVAASSAETTLQNQYNTATRENSDINCRRILFAAADIVSDRGIATTLNFRTDELRAHYQHRFGTELKSNSLGGHLRKLTPNKDGQGGIIERVGHGVYRFRDLRMVAYVSVRDESDQLVVSVGS